MVNTTSPKDTAVHNQSHARCNDIISDLMNALAIILREAEKSDASRHYIIGAAKQAMAICDSQRERNADGYLIAKDR